MKAKHFTLEGAAGVEARGNWGLSSETHRAGLNPPITPTRNLLRVHCRQGKYSGARSVFSPTSGHPGVGQVEYRRYRFSKKELS